MKTVVYQGYEFQVPASWPVYRLDEHPQTCVRYDIHAVYLGKPGPNMRCAAGLIGRTETVSFIPGEAGAAGTGARRPGQAAQAGRTDLQRLPAVHGIILQDAVTDELSVTLGPGALGATVLGTYATDPALIERVLNTLRRAPAGVPQTTQTAGAPAQPGTSRGTRQRAQLSAEPGRVVPQGAPATSTSWRGLPAHWPVQIVKSPPVARPPQPPKPKPVRPLGGFDTCTAPSLTTMHAWRSNYAVVGAYLGGADAACAFGNLSASWVQKVTKTGWGILPIYVGPQAPCWSGGGVKINGGKAAAQGKAAGADAVNQARSFGIRTGSPIYYDMEAYAGGSSCTAAVLGFLSAWDRKVAAAGYVTGVYSSQDSGITDIESAAVAGKPGFTPPDAIWIALWDGKPTLKDGRLVWPLSARAKQYAGNVNATVKGITLTVDKDIVGGPVARLLTLQVQ
ncbi:MAG TPA: glycoside hydrolase domain-containing protein [Trebonia sp.]|nr:glycoside hydrolase domain-containing protein [Trebonia sp.]